MIVITPEQELGRRSNPPHAGPGLGTVADHVAEAYANIMRLGEDGCERGRIAVDVGNDQGPHGSSFGSAQPLAIPDLLRLGVFITLALITLVLESTLDRVELLFVA